MVLDHFIGACTLYVTESVYFYDDFDDHLRSYLFTEYMEVLKCV